jgi:hypothetical protein
MQCGINVLETFKHHRGKRTPSHRKDRPDYVVNCAIPEGDQGSLRTYNTNNSTNSKGAKEVGSNNTNIGYGETYYHNS